MKTPDITPAQVISVLTAIVAQFVARGILDNATAQTIVQIAGIVLPAVWMLADAIIRHGRSRAMLHAPMAQGQAGTTLKRP
jgi:hypothetical protein